MSGIRCAELAGHRHKTSEVAFAKLVALYGMAPQVVRDEAPSCFDVGVMRFSGWL